MTAERNQHRSEAAEAARQADKLTQRLSALPKARPFCSQSWQVTAVRRDSGDSADFIRSALCLTHA